MAFKADSSQAALQILVDGVTSPVTADAQVIELCTVSGSTATAVNPANPLPVAIAAVYIDENGNKLTTKRAFQNAGAGAETVVVTAVGGKAIRVVAGYFIAGSVATNLTFQSKPAGGGAAIGPTVQNVNNSGLVLPFLPLGWHQTVSGEALSVLLGGGSTVGVQVVYVEV